MKLTKLFLPAVLLLSLVSCGKDTQCPSQNDALCFRTDVDGLRVEDLTATSMQSFKVTAFDSDNQLYMDGVVVNKIANSTTWEPEKKFYWMKPSYTFFAFSPVSLSSSFTINATTKQLANFAPNHAAHNQVDIVVAHNQGLRDRDMAGGVPLSFKHPLSKVSVRAKNGSKTYSFKIVGVKLAIHAHAGTFTFPTSYTTSNPHNGTPTAQNSYIAASDWSSIQKGTNKEASYVILSDGNAHPAVTLAANATDQKSLMFGEAGFFVIPQELTPWTPKSDPSTDDTGAYIAVLCQITKKTDKGDEVVFPKPQTDGSSPASDKYGFVAVPIKGKLEPGKHYVYTLTFCADDKPSGGKIAPNPKSPEDVIGNDDRIEPNPVPDKRPGDDVLSADKPVGPFEPIIDPWEPGEEIDIDL